MAVYVFELISLRVVIINENDASEFSLQLVLKFRTLAAIMQK